jgi:hypothetical protein
VGVVTGSGAVRNEIIIAPRDFSLIAAASDSSWKLVKMARRPFFETPNQVPGKSNDHTSVEISKTEKSSGTAGWVLTMFGSSKVTTGEYFLVWSFPEGGSLGWSVNKLL